MARRLIRNIPYPIYSQRCLDNLVHIRYWFKPKTGCWIWNGKRTNLRTGYVRINNKQVGCGRFVYQNLVADPGDKVERMVCEDKLCVNPGHLYSLQKLT